MELFKIKIYVNSSIKNIQEIKFIQIGVGKGFANKLPVFMEKKMIKLEQQKGKRYKIIQCLENNF